MSCCDSVITYSATGSYNNIW